MEAQGKKGTVFTRKIETIAQETQFANNKLTEYVRTNDKSSWIAAAALIPVVGPLVSASGMIANSGERSPLNPQEDLLELAIQNVYYQALQEYLYPESEANLTTVTVEMKARPRFMAITDVNFQNLKEGEHHYTEGELRAEMTRLRQILLFGDKVKGSGALSFIEGSESPVIEEKLVSTIDNFIATGNQDLLNNFVALYHREKSYAAGDEGVSPTQTARIHDNDNITVANLDVTSAMPAFMARKTELNIPAYLRRAPKEREESIIEQEWTPENAKVPDYLVRSRAKWVRRKDPDYCIAHGLRPITTTIPSGHPKGRQM